MSSNQNDGGVGSVGNTQVADEALAEARRERGRKEHCDVINNYNRKRDEEADLAAHNIQMAWYMKDMKEMSE